MDLDSVDIFEADLPHESKCSRKFQIFFFIKLESNGRCIANLKITSIGGENNGLYEHKFMKNQSNCQVNLMGSGIMENNYVIISIDNRPAVATGYVTTISLSTITVALDRVLTKKYNNENFHIDTYDSAGSHLFNLSSLSLLLENTARAKELRSLIIDKTHPTFVSKLPSMVAKKGAAILKRLNRVQQRAVLKALCAEQFLLIKGMPGTGKSATIVALIQLLIELNKSVLITSHTHSAIDNICTRLQKFEIDFIRLGTASKIDPSLHANSESYLTKDCTTAEDLENVYNKFKVVAVTCLGSGHALLSKRVFDICIVDESTQAVQTSLIRPLYASKTFVLIGDPDQLAPVIKNKDAREAGMSESLFERLSYCEETIALNLNYRMNQPITDLANKLTYKGQLEPANDAVANRCLQIPNVELINELYTNKPWVLKALKTSLNNSIQFIDTGPVWNLPRKNLNKNVHITDTSETDRCANIYEAAIAATLVKALTKGGIATTDIGIIATYRAQVSQICSLLNDTVIDINTVDQFQGRDKNVVIYSCSKSVDTSKKSSDSQMYELLEDNRRLTVAITRAKRKLIIIGDLNTLQNYSTFSKILEELRRNIIVLDMETILREL